MLHRKSPGTRVCMCTKWGCVWMRKAKARCQKRTKGGRKKQKIEMPWCVHIADGKKVMIRNRHCTCPSGWRNRDKCLSPNDDHTNPCFFSHPVNGTKYEEIKFSTDNVILNCQGKKLSWLDDFGELEGPIVKMVVPGHTTEINFKNTGLYDIEGYLLEGAYKLHKADFSHNFIRYLPYDLFKKNHIITSLDISYNQMRSIPPRLFLGLNMVQEINMSNNLVGSIHKLLFKGKYFLYKTPRVALGVLY